MRNFRKNFAQKECTAKNIFNAVALSIPCMFQADKVYSVFDGISDNSKTSYYSLLHRTVLFLFTVLIALFVLFVLGNIQNFLDSSQIIILQFLIAGGILLFLVAVFALLFEINYSIYLRKPYYLGHCIISGIACIFGLVIAIAASAILLLSSGLNPA